MRYQLGSFTITLGADTTRFTQDTCADCGYPIPSWWPIRFNYADGTRHYLCGVRHAKKVGR
jgi:rRNA maturation protein Nop10